ncbi:unnamed protein product [Aphanomyces euteiches]
MSKGAPCSQVLWPSALEVAKKPLEMTGSQAAVATEDRTMCHSFQSEVQKPHGAFKAHFRLSLNEDENCGASRGVCLALGSSRCTNPQAAS